MNLKNKQLIDIKLEGETYVLTAAISEPFLDDWDTYEFNLVQRYSGEIVLVEHKQIEQIDTFYIFELTISVDQCPFFQADEVIDLSIVRRRGDEEKRSRIKSNYDYIELLQLPLNEEKITHPFTTKGGNISFNIRENYLFARVDHAEVSDDSILDVYGLYYHGHIPRENIERVEIVAKTTFGESEIIYQTNQIGLPDMYEGKHWSESVMDNGFHASIDLKPHMTIGRGNFFKLYVRIIFKEDGELCDVQSGRLKVNPNSTSMPIRKKHKFGPTTMLITCKPTKNAKYLSIRVGQYKVIRESVRYAKGKWVETRRSKQVLKVYKTVFYFMGKVNRTNKRLAVFESFHGKQYSDSPRAIYEYMLEHNPEMKLVWSADRRHVKNFAQAGIPHVRRFSAKWLMLMTSAGYWVTNARLPLWIPKPKRTTYVQTWHGTPLKRLATDMEEVHMPGTNAEKYKQNFISEASKWDYLVSPNEYSTKIFRRAFMFDREMLETGYPRNDYLYQQNNAKTIGRIRESIGIESGKKVILYAPTWRDNQFYGKGQYKFNLEMDLDQLQEQFGDTHVIVLRMHYLVAENLDISQYEGFVYDCSTYDDIRDLYLISDVLITDYSSVFFDYANLRRPMIFFVYDIEEYRDNLRGFYFDFEKKAPGPLVKTTAGLIKELTKIEKDGFNPDENFNEFIDRFCYLEDGNASKRVVEAVFTK